MSARAAQEKMYEHASAILAKSSSASRLFHERHLGVDSRAHKSGEADADVKPKGKRNSLVLRCIILYNFEFKTGTFFECGFRKKLQLYTFLEFKVHLSFSTGKKMCLIFEAIQYFD
jgi:hypothetical protein